jgi:hypothetical protein
MPHNVLREREIADKTVSTFGSVVKLAKNRKLTVQSLASQ